MDKPKPKASNLRAILSGIKTILRETTPGKTAYRAAGQVALDRMAENLDPYNYSSWSGGVPVSAEKRAIDAILRNKKEKERGEQERFIEKGYGKQPDPTFKERVDLLQILANKKQKYNTVKESQYKPTEGDVRGKKYYSSKGIENEIISNLLLGDNTIKSEKDIMKIISEKALEKKDGGRAVAQSSAQAIIPGLGAATYKVGRDSKGVYLSYSDLWDLDPTQGAYADVKKASRPLTIEGLTQKAVKEGIKAVSMAGSPANVYGRIYFDPKTGKPIR